MFEFSIPVASFSYTQLWYKHGTMEIGTPEFLQISIVGPIGKHEMGQFAGPYWSLQFLHQPGNYIFWLSIPVASFWYKHYFGADMVPWRQVDPNFTRISLSALQASMKRGSMQACTGVGGSCTGQQITFLGSSYPQLLFDMKISLVQTRYHGDRYTQIFANFHCRPYMAQHETVWFVGPYWSERFLHRLENDIFRLSISAQLPFDISIALVQTRYLGDRQTRISAKFYCRLYTAQHETGWFAGQYWSVRFLHRLKN